MGHDPGAKGSKQVLDALLAELNDPATPTLNVDGWCFPADEDDQINLSERIFEKPVSLKGAIFKGDLSFKSAKFRQSADFSGALFEGEADFTDAQLGNTDPDFTILTVYDHAHFKKAVRFQGVKFFQETSFKHSRFENVIDLDKGTEFHAKAIFNGAKFEGEANMGEALFYGMVELQDSHFGGFTKFTGTKFKDQALFDRAVFVKLVEFSQAEFEKLARFDSTESKERAVFEGTKFLSGGDANFDRAKFTGSVSFKNTKFNRTTYFTDTVFAKKAEFEGTEFNENANFVKTVFDEGYFKSTKFKKTSKFDRAQFNNMKFSSAEFCGELIFDHIQFLKLTVLDRVSLCGKASFNVQVDARSKLALRNMSLSRVEFGESNVENIDFENVKWVETEIYRLRIADEPEVSVFRRAADELGKLEQARRLYRQLRLNYDKVGEYEKGGRFYVSESEMSYFMLSPVYRWIHPRGLYKRASRYGESVVQAASLMVGLILIFASLYWVISLVRPIWFKEPPKMLGPGSLVTLSWWEAVWLSLQASKPTADLGLSPNTIVYWLVFAEGLVVPTQIALFLLAIRRRFRRGD